MADRLTADLPRLAKLSTSSAVDMKEIEEARMFRAKESEDGRDDVVTIADVRGALRWTVTVDATAKGKSSTHAFDDESAAAAFVEGFVACAKLRRRGPRKAAAK